AAALAAVTSAGRADPPLRLWSLDPSHDRAPAGKPGLSQVFDDVVSDDHVVLLVRDGSVGAFVLSGQQPSPEAAKVRWIFRRSGLGRLSLKDPECTSGEAWLTEENGWFVRFGPFDVYWERKWSQGRIAYAEDWGTSVCFTNIKSLDDVDPLESRWVYR